MTQDQCVTRQLHLLRCAQSRVQTKAALRNSASHSACVSKLNIALRDEELFQGSSPEQSRGGLAPLKGQEWPEKSKEPGTKRCSVPRAAMSKRGMLRGWLSVRLPLWWAEMFCHLWEIGT